MLMSVHITNLISSFQRASCGVMLSLAWQAGISDMSKAGQKC